MIYKGTKAKIGEIYEKKIKESDAVFLLLGLTLSPDKRDSAYTQNWIAFEVGIVCRCDPPKKVFFFHPAYDGNSNEYDKNEFVISYLIDYIYYDSNNTVSYDITLKIIRTFDPDTKISVVESLLMFMDFWSDIEHYDDITIHLHYRMSKL